MQSYLQMLQIYIVKERDWEKQEGLSKQFELVNEI